MKRSIVVLAGALALGVASVLSGVVVSALAAQSTVIRAAAVETMVFVVANMTCALCPVTVKKAMARVVGVRSVEIDFAARTATVTFDPSMTTPEAIAAAATNAGYPATPQRSGPDA
jgi:mercuric ion binding protein